MAETDAIFFRVQYFLVLFFQILFLAMLWHPSGHFLTASIPFPFSVSLSLNRGHLVRLFNVMCSTIILASFGEQLSLHAKFGFC